MDRKKVLRIAAVSAIVLLAIFAMSVFTNSTRGYQAVDTSVALQQLSDGNAKKVQINDREQQLQIELKNSIDEGDKKGLTKIVTQYPALASDEVFDAVQKASPESFQTKVTKESWISSTISFLVPMLIFFGLVMFFLSRMQGGSGMGGPFGFGRSRARELTKDMPTNTFADVAGAEEAVEELTEIRDFLQGPERYEALGAKIPRGVLLYGPPGTGKTLLARAVAGEAGVPFYSISGSDFVEMFVGVGASRVRDLFAQAKENSPCIIFVDEIDAVGRQRGSGMGGGHDEREQTLNQLLVEMDGFGDRQGVILIAATNRPDILDPALLRPGRFDRQIPVTNPDLAGREQILAVHAKNKPLAPDVDLKSLAKRTAGMSGADLANVLNEAALLTARVDGNVITADALEEATDRVVGGPRRSSKIISEHEKKVTAYHEGGHTLAAWAMQDIERVYKVTILARGRTGGHAMTAAEDDKGMYNRAELFARLVFAMGGRSGEELVFGSPTTGASADIEQATKIARAMVTEYGMSPTLGAVKYGSEQGDPFAGYGGGGGVLDYSPEVAAAIDRDVRFLIEKAHDEAYAILKENRATLDLLAEKLLEKETLRRPDLEKIFENVKPRPRLEIFEGEGTLHPVDTDNEPVKTPVELAKERGEEPPRRVDFLEASRQARKAREAAAAEAAAAGGPGAGTPGAPGAGAPVNGAGGVSGTSDVVNTPVYGGTPPPAGWTAPGWPPAGQSPTYEQERRSRPERPWDNAGQWSSPSATPTTQRPVDTGVQQYGAGTQPQAGAGAPQYGDGTQPHYGQAQGTPTPQAMSPYGYPASGQPVHAAQPSQPAQTGQAPQHGQPAHSTQPGQPVHAAQPGQTSAPAQPGQVAQPAQPGQTAAHATQPGQATVPPAQPSAPAHSAPSTSDTQVMPATHPDTQVLPAANPGAPRAGAPLPEGELRGFVLPAHERPDYPERDDDGEGAR